jgi:hypothetical protein
MSDGSLPGDYDYNHVAAGVAVLAAIAASDARGSSPHQARRQARPSSSRLGAGLIARNVLVTGTALRRGDEDATI